MTIENYLSKADWAIRENANFTYSHSGLEAYLAGDLMKRWALEHSPARKEHLKGVLHIHDLNKIAIPYCSGHSLEGLFQKGIRVKLGANSRPAKHLSAACNQIFVYLSLMSQEFSGAQAFSDVDAFLAPFIWYNRMDYKDVKQALQELVFNLNYPARIGFQTIFSNFTFDGLIPPYLENKRVIWNGEVQEKTYGDFDKETEMLNEAFLDVMLEGDATKRPFTFPIPTINVTKELLKQPIFEKWLGLASKYGLPYFDNYIGTDRSPGSTRAMCCHLLLNMEDLPAHGIWSMPSHTGSTGIVTINMPQIGYLSKDDDEVFERLSRALEKAKEQLLWKRALIDRSQKNGLVPCTNFYGITLRNYYQTIGWIGLNEFCLNYFGAPLEENVDFVSKLMHLVRDRLKDFKEETNLLWNFEATPAEGSSHSLALVDKRQYPDIQVQGEGENIYYTNSTFLAVNSPVGIFDRVEIQEKLQPLYTGGTIWHLWLGELYPDLEALVPRMCQTKLPYFTITPTYSICPKEGRLLPGEVTKCPLCEEPAEVYSRVVGYYRPVSNWHRGKQREFSERRTFEKDLDKLQRI